MADQEHGLGSSQSITKEIHIEQPESRRESSSSDSDIIEETVEPYDDFAEPIRVLSKQHHVGDAALSKQVTGVTMTTTITSDPDFEVDFEPNDPGNPKNWSLWKVCLMIFFIAYTTLCIVLYSTSYTSAIPGIMEAFDVRSETVAVLGVTVYLLGLAIGSVVLAPLSEMYGRRPVYLITISLFTILIIPCALAQNLEAILITRFIGSLFGAAMISNAPGSINDLVTGK
jgi:Major Facilitator Superfamily